MPEAEQYSTKILTDAKAAVTPSEAYGMATGEVNLAEKHAAPGAVFNTGALYRDLAPFGSKAQVPTSGAEDQ